MSVSKEELYHIAKLSKLEISEEKIDELTQKISDIVSFSNTLANIDIEGVKPTAHILDLKNVLRKDEVKDSFSRETILQNAPEIQGGCVSVPKVVE
jgi:aspartyl-tRNA(Asn)/glutamyl-tRNA(Gln) amidotransferase subunit C